MDLHSAIELGVAVVGAAALIVSMRISFKKSRLASLLHGEVVAGNAERVRMEELHNVTLTATYAAHESAVVAMTKRHSLVVAAHVAIADQLKDDIVCLKEEHVLALEKAELEKIAAVARVENKIEDFRTRQQELMDEIFGYQQRELIDPAQMVGALKPAAAGQIVSLADAKKAALPVAAFQSEEEAAPVAVAKLVMPAVVIPVPAPLPRIAAVSLEPADAFAGDEAFAEADLDIAASKASATPVNLIAKSAPKWLEGPLGA